MSKISYIAITMRVDLFSDRGEERSSIDNKLIDWVKSIGFVPLLLPNSKSLDLKDYLNQYPIKGFIISGGNSIKKNSARYLLENQILKYSISKRLPVLGICHGMQMMSHFESGKLKRVSNHVATEHKLVCNLKKNDYPKKVNSYHNYKIDNLSHNFRIICKCEKGTIEAIQHKRYNWLGWMWHPERDKIFDKKLIKIAKKMFN